MNIVIKQGFYIKYWWQGSAPLAALYPTVSAMATVGNRSGLSPGCAAMWVVPSDLLSDPEGHPSSGPPLVTLYHRVMPLETPLL